MIKVDMPIPQKASYYSSLGIPDVENPYMIMEFLNLDRDKAGQVIGLISEEIDPGEYESVENWERQLYNPPREVERIMHALNEVIEGYGIEGIEVEDAYVDSYHHGFIADYINTGDTYNPTIVLDNSNNEFILTTWGNFLQAYEEEQAQENSDDEDWDW